MKNLFNKMAVAVLILINATFGLSAADPHKQNGLSVRCVRE